VHIQVISFADHSKFVQATSQVRVFYFLYFSDH